MTKLNINNIDKNYDVLVQYLLMDDDKRNQSKLSLKSMGNPNNIDQATDFVLNFIKNHNKYSFYLNSENKKTIVKIIYKSLLKNRSIKKELDVFYRKISSIVAKTKVETGFVIGSYANNSYKKIINH